MEDRDLFSQIIHGAATRMEYLDMVNANRDAFEIYVNDGGGQTLLTDTTVDEADFAQIERSVVTFGEGGISDAEAPYTPKISMSLGLTYNWKGRATGFNVHHVGEQFTKFHNFVNESTDGAIGQLPSFTTIDAYLNHDLKIGEGMDAKIFVNAKNITNEIYRASRLIRATSGLFAGGFRQIVFGIELRL